MPVIIIIKLGGCLVTEKDAVCEYYKTVFQDIHEARKIYPYIKVTVPPTAEAAPILLKAVAVNISLLETTHAEYKDFIGAFSRELEIIIPFDYRKSGCKVYGGKWIDTNLVSEDYRHFNGKRKDGWYLFCVGVPGSFREMNNVILENIRTAEEMLIAYQLYQTGETKTLMLNAYSHGMRGIDEYIKDKKRYNGK